MVRRSGGGKRRRRRRFVAPRPDATLSHPVKMLGYINFVIWTALGNSWSKRNVLCITE
jgi:hypothetical protein